MSEDYSLVGYESVPVAEYLPILTNIKHDLKFIYEKYSQNFTTLSTMNMPTIGKESFTMESNFKKTVSLNDISVNTINESIQTDCHDIRSLYPESEKQMIDHLNKIVLLIPNGESMSGNGLELSELLNTVELYVKSVKTNSNNDHNPDYETIYNYKEELDKLKDEFRIKELEMNRINDSIDQKKDQLIQKDGKIETLRNQNQKLTDDISIKDIKIDNFNKKIKNLKEDIERKDETIYSLQEEIKKTQKEKSLTNVEIDNKRANPEMKKMIEEKIYRITELETQIHNLEQNINENNEKDERIVELENEIKNIMIQNDQNLDDNYQQLLSNLKNKRTELRERDTKIQDLENEISEFQNKLRKTEREMKKLNQINKELSQELSEAESLKDDFEAKYKLVLKENKGLKKNICSEDEMENLKSEIKKSKELLKEKDNEMRNFNGLTEKYQSQSNLIKDLIEKVKKMENCEKNLIDKNKELEDKSKEITSLKADIEKKQQAITTMREKIKTKNSDQVDPHELRKLQNQIKSKEMELDQAHAKIENLNKAYDNLANEHDLSKKQVEQFKTEIENMKKLNFSNRTYEPKKETGKSQNVDNKPEWWKQHMKN